MKLFKLIIIILIPLPFFDNFSVYATEIYKKDASAFNQKSLKADVGEQTQNILFSDIFPGDWAYTALQNLSSRYTCVENKFLKSLRIGQALTRYEAAELLNYCLEADFSFSELSSEALRLYKEFSFEIAIVKARSYQLN